MPRIFLGEKKTRLRAGDRVTLQMRQGIGTISRGGVPLTFEALNSREKLLIYRFEIGTRSDMEQARRFLDFLGCTKLMLVRVADGDFQTSRFDLTKGDGHGT